MVSKKVVAGAVAIVAAIGALAASSKNIQQKIENVTEIVAVQQAGSPAVRASAAELDNELNEANELLKSAKLRLADLKEFPKLVRV